MARVATPNLGLGTWVDGENPGAGDQVVDNTGLNGNFIKIDTAVGTEHNTNGTHKDDKIEGRSLKAAVVDGTTLEASAATGAKSFRVKDDGITGAKIAAAAADGTTLEASAATGAKSFRVKDSGISTAKIADDAVTAPKISHDNNRTKVYHTVSLPAVAGYAYLHQLQFTPVKGIPVGRAGTVTLAEICDNAGVTNTSTAAYGAAGQTFPANAMLIVDWSGSFVNIKKVVGGVLTTLLQVGIGTTPPLFCSIEVELDD